MTYLKKIFRGILYSLPLCLCVLGIYFCTVAMLYYSSQQADMGPAIDKAKSNYIFLLPLLSIGAFHLMVFMALFTTGTVAFGIGLPIAVFTKRVPLALRRLGIVASALLLTIAGIMWVRYFIWGCIT
jgi:hypothetical protein